MAPHVARCAEAVQHDDRRAMSADAYVDLGAVGFDLTRLHTGREGVDAVLMSDVVHRFTPRFKGTGALSAWRSGCPVAPVDLPGRCPGPQSGTGATRRGTRRTRRRRAGVRRRR